MNARSMRVRRIVSGPYFCLHSFGREVLMHYLLGRSIWIALLLAAVGGRDRS